MRKFIVAIMVLIAVSTCLSAQKKRTVSEVMDSYIKQSEELVIRALELSPRPTVYDRSELKDKLSVYNDVCNDWDIKDKERLFNALNGGYSISDIELLNARNNLHNEWNKMQENAARTLFKNMYEITYKENLSMLPFNQKNYTDKTITVKGFISLKRNKKYESEKYESFIETINKNLSLIPEIKTWGQELKVFPWEYINNDEKSLSVEYLIQNGKGKTVKEGKLFLNPSKSLTSFVADMDINEYGFKLHLNSNDKSISVMSSAERVKNYIKEKKCDLEKGWKPDAYIVDIVTSLSEREPSYPEVYFCNELSLIYGLYPAYDIYESSDCLLYDIYLEDGKIVIGGTGGDGGDYEVYFTPRLNSFYLLPKDSYEETLDDIIKGDGYSYGHYNNAHNDWIEGKNGNGRVPNFTVFLNVPESH